MTAIVGACLRACNKNVNFYQGGSLITRRPHRGSRRSTAFEPPFLSRDRDVVSRGLREEKTAQKFFSKELIICIDIRVNILYCSRWKDVYRTLYGTIVNPTAL